MSEWVWLAACGEWLTGWQCVCVTLLGMTDSSMLTDAQIIALVIAGD